MKPIQPLCPVCQGPLPPTSSSRRIYCSAKCRSKAKSRRHRHQEIFDAEVLRSSELKAQLQEQERRIARLEALVKRQRHLNAKNRSRALEAQSAVATARNRQRKSEIRVAAAYKKLISDYTERIEELEAQNFVLRHQAEEAQQKHAEAQVAAEYLLGQSQHFKKEMKTAASAIAKLKASLSAPSAIFVDYRYFARWYFQKKPKREWDDHDYNRLQRLNTYVKSASTAQQARNLRHGQKPKARVRMNRFQ